MKVAISTDNGHVSEHFGRCPEFTILQIDDGKITKQDTIPNPGHNPGYLPVYFEQMGVEAVVAGGGGQRAQMLFAEKNIQFILGITGTIDETVDQLCKGELKGGESLCKPGGGKGYGVEKDECDHGEHDHGHC
jgi:predicted Fe-Mo cluster-binding NifX family protein